MNWYAFRIIYLRSRIIYANDGTRCFLLSWFQVGSRLKMSFRIFRRGIQIIFPESNVPRETILILKRSYVLWRTLPGRVKPQTAKILQNPRNFLTFLPGATNFMKFLGRFQDIIQICGPGCQFSFSTNSILKLITL